MDEHYEEPIDGGFKDATKSILSMIHGEDVSSSGSDSDDTSLTSEEEEIEEEMDELN